jgi:hypothetical protein
MLVKADAEICGDVLCAAEVVFAKEPDIAGTIGGCFAGTRLIALR